MPDDPKMPQPAGGEESPPDDGDSSPLADQKASSSDGLKLKDIDAPCLEESGAIPDDANPDTDGYTNIIAKLELGETKLKYSLRGRVARGLTFCAAVILGVFIWHLIMPHCLRWLPPEEIAALKGLALTLFGALAMSIATLFLAKK